MKRILTTCLGVLLLAFITACAPVTLTPQGAETAAMRSDTASALPGHPFDNCKTITHLTTEYTFECRSVEDLGIKLRNSSGAAGANLVLITNLIDPGHSCYHQAAGIAISCDPEALRAAGITSENLTPGITAVGPIQGLFGR